MTITFGTQKQVDTSGDRVNIVKLTSTTAIGFYSSVAGGLQARHLTLASGIITLGANELTVDGVAGITNFARSTRLTDTSVMAVWHYGAGTAHRARIITVSGTTLTAHTLKNLTDTLGLSASNSVDTLSSTACVYVYQTTANNGIARVLSVSGTTITENASFQFDATGAFNVSVAVLSTTKAVVCWIDSNNSDRPTGEVLNISGTTITGNADVELSTTAGIQTVSHNLMVRAINSLKLLVGWVQDGTSKTYGLILTESSDTLTFGSLWTSTSTAPGAFREIAVAINSTSKATVSVKHSAGNEIPVWELSLTGTTITEDSTSTISGATGINDQWIVNLGAGSNIIIWDGTTEAISASVVVIENALDLADSKKPCDVDADGGFIYIAALSSGNPILIKLNTDLASDGITTFTPGAGTNIGVQCGRFDSGIVYVAGDFGGSDTIEKSSDSGDSFTVIDPATFGPVASFTIGPDTDDRILIQEEDDGIIAESIDSGTVWTTLNASAAIGIISIARLDKNVQEIVFGGISSASDNIDYTVNSGVNTEDIGASPFPQSDVNGVLVN